MRLRYTKPALAELADILEYIAARSPLGERNVQARIKQIVQLLVQFPRAGTLTDDPTIRCIATTPFPYLIFYEVAGDEVIVHSIRHGARDPSATPESV